MESPLKSVREIGPTFSKGRDTHTHLLLGCNYRQAVVLLILEENGVFLVAEQLKGDFQLIASLANAAVLILTQSQPNLHEILILFLGCDLVAWQQ